MGEEYAGIKTDVGFRNDIRRSFATFHFTCICQRSKPEHFPPAESERRHRGSLRSESGCDTKDGLEHVLDSLAMRELCGF